MTLADTPTGLVIVASTRAARGEYEDLSGPIAVDFLRELGFETPAPVVVADADIPATLDQLFARPEDLPDVLLTSGGTGVTPDDLTVDALLPHLERLLPGVVQAFFLRGLDNTPLAVVSRAVAGTHGRTFCMTLPGSQGGVRDGCEVLRPLLPHLTELLHRAPDSTPAPSAPSEPPAELLAARISETPLEEFLPEARALTATDAAGAVAIFEGIVRNHDGGQSVNSLTYSAHPSAEDELRRVCLSVLSHFPGVRAWVAHRVGPLTIGECAFLVVVASAHRREAFAALAELTDRVKADVPIWKEQHMGDGSTQWVGL